MEKRNQAGNSDVSLIQERIVYKTELFKWCLRNAQKCMRREKLNDALAWNECAARVFSSSCVPLGSEVLERNLLNIARRLPVPEWTPAHDPGAPRRWLHVVDSYAVNGGHASMARRWILSDPCNHVHSVAFPFLDNLPVPGGVVGAVRRSGGEVFTPEPGSSLLQRAEWLRKLAFAKADYVVLHISSSNVVAPTAFGVDGGPPVLLTNHVAHVFWTGSPVADLVLNCRGSRLECEWTEQLRAIPRAAILPIPLLLDQIEGESFSPEFRAHARAVLGVPDDSVVLLTVGRADKYHGIPGLDFAQVADSVLACCPNTRMFVVGLDGGIWKRANKATQHRLISAGRVSDLSVYHAAADLYLEGFPFGSTTAMLEAAVYGVPCVLPPADAPPPFTSDGIALDGELQRPANVAEYINTVRDLVRDPAERHRRGQSLARSIRAHHTGPGWQRYLADLIHNLPNRHSVHPIPVPAPPPEQIQNFWETYTLQVEQNVPSPVLKSSVLCGLRPWLDPQLLRAYLNARLLRRREGRLPFLLAIVLGLLLPLCPSSARVAFHDRLVSICGEHGIVTKAIRILRYPGRLLKHIPAYRNAAVRRRLDVQA